MNSILKAGIDMPPAAGGVEEGDVGEVEPAGNII